MHLILGALVLLGIYFLVPDFDLENDYSKAIALGVLSAFCYALRNIIMKSKVNRYNGSIMMFYQLVIIAIILSPFFLYLDTSGIMPQFPANLTLALVTTAIGHTLFLYSFNILAPALMCELVAISVVFATTFLTEGILSFNQLSL